VDRWLHAFLSAGFAALTVDVLWGVFSRYVLGHQSRWTEELALYLLVWVSLLGASAAYAEGSHLGVDYLVGKLDPAARHLAAISVELLVIFFAAFVLLYGGAELAFKTLQSDQLSPALGVPMGYVYLAAPVSGVLFVLFSLENLARLWSEAPWNRKS
jgi:TRAP-type C4-dicarboxylate transport system permease small subunit